MPQSQDYIPLINRKNTLLWVKTNILDCPNCYIIPQIDRFTEAITNSLALGLLMDYHCEKNNIEIVNALGKIGVTKSLLKSFLCIDIWRLGC